jgi:hypothetical protein
MLYGAYRSATACAIGARTGDRLSTLHLPLDDGGALRGADVPGRIEPRRREYVACERSAHAFPWWRSKPHYKDRRSGTRASKLSRFETGEVKEFVFDDPMSDGRTLEVVPGAGIRTGRPIGH